MELVYPGDFITNEEEFSAGSGTFSEDGRVKASQIGYVEKDVEKRVVRVKPLTNYPREQGKGMEVYGVVAQMREKLAFVDLAPSVKDGARYFPKEASTLLRINNVKRGFVKEMSNEFEVGDIIRARILDNYDDVNLTTDGPHLGVVRGFCSKCRSVLNKKDNGLECPNCGWKDHRHTSDDYRSVKE